MTKRSEPSLPEEFAVVKPAFCLRKEPKNSSLFRCHIKRHVNTDKDNKKEEIEWLNHVVSNGINIGLDTSWAAYHASSNRTQTDFVQECQLLPLFFKNSSSISMIKQAMSIIKEVTRFPMATKIPCPGSFISLAKFIKWNSPEEYDETQFVVIFGEFHTEQAFLKIGLVDVRK